MTQQVPGRGVPVAGPNSGDPGLSPVSPEGPPRLSDPHRSALHDYGKMLAVGAVGLTLDFGLFNLLLRMGWNPVWANLLALVVAGLVTFKGNLDITFAHRNIPDRRQALIRFAVVTVLGVLFVEVAVAVAGVLGAGVLALNIVKAVVTVIAVIVRFYAYREWVFEHVAHDQGA